MASKAPPAYPEPDQQPAEDAPPAYNDATGTLDHHQDGLQTKTQVRSQLSIIVSYRDMN
jgi:hypothetical protein